MMKAKVKKEQQITEKPFILNFLEYHQGAMSPTTSGTYDDIDCADRDSE